MAGIRIADADLKSAVSGTEKIPVDGDEGSGNAAISPNLIADKFGSWADYTPTFGGFSTPPTVDLAKYCKIGKLCFVVVVLSGSSVSNATTFTITMPFNAGVAMIGSFQTPVDNNSTTGAGFMTFTAGSNVATLFKPSAVSWTASSVKRGRFSTFYITE